MHKLDALRTTSRGFLVWENNKYYSFTIRVARVIIILSGGKSAMPMTQKEMVKLLTAHGWIKTKGGKGSHIKMEKQGERPITIPHGELNKYTERGIRKQAGL